MSLQAMLCIRLVGVIFCISALAKAWAPNSLSTLLLNLGIRTKFIQQGITLGLIFIESLLGFYLLSLEIDWSLPIALALLLGMIGILTFLYKQGFREKCSCYGQWLKLSPVEAIKLDFVYVVMLVFAISEVDEHHQELKSNPIMPLLIALGLMGLGKLRFKKVLNEQS